MVKIPKLEYSLIDGKATVKKLTIIDYFHIIIEKHFQPPFKMSIVLVLSAK